jgi:hypothetical protein
VYIHGICHKQKKVKTQKLYKRNGNKWNKEREIQ